MLGHLAQNRYVLDLSNEVLYALEGQEAAKISGAKVGGQKKITNAARFESAAPGVRLNRQIFFRSPTLTSDIFVVP